LNRARVDRRENDRFSFKRCRTFSGFSLHARSIGTRTQEQGYHGLMLHVDALGTGRHVSHMTIIEFIRAFADDTPVAVVITDTVLESPGPTILYANPAFGALTGRDCTTIVGLTPRFMQGRETRRATLDAFHQALAANKPFHGFLSNYRPDGTRYRVEIDCRPLLSASGKVEHFIAFEREVVRRLGRPALSRAGRYVPAHVSNALLTDALRSMNVFHSNETDQMT